MRLSGDLLREILDCEEPRMRQGRGTAPALLMVTAEEGQAMRFGHGEWGDAALEGLTARAVAEIGAKVIEHAVRSTLVLELTTGDRGTGDVSCRVDRGAGWEPVEVAASGAAEGGDAKRA